MVSFSKQRRWQWPQPHLSSSPSPGSRPRHFHGPGALLPDRWGLGINMTVAVTVRMWLGPAGATGACMKREARGGIRPQYIIQSNRQQPAQNLLTSNSLSLFSSSEAQLCYGLKDCLHPLPHTQIHV